MARRAQPVAASSGADKVVGGNIVITRHCCRVPARDTSGDTSVSHMVTWVPYCPPSCSTRGKPFPLGAFSKGLGAGEWVGAVRCWAQQGDTFLVGSIQNTRYQVTPPPTSCHVVKLC